MHSPAELAKTIDHTLLKPGMLLADALQLCTEANENGFAAVCVPPLFVKPCRQHLGHSHVKLATVIGFPFGYSATEAKLAECLLAIVDGADELDVVVNFTAIKNNDWAYLANELNHLMPVIKNSAKCIKVIIESGVLTPEEIEKCCTLYGAAGVDFVKTSTGYATVGATVEAVALMRQHLPAHVAIKASGGIKTASFASQLLQAGATRLGTSNGIAILTQSLAQGEY
ncbi:MAG: deoxyribose-phosphate aldolase [Bacteroidetes bacterium]|nr:MAG: deoxyribose-phosphate aldolase [Bacteroidota bacterium]